MADVSLPAIPVVLGTAAVDAVNPCAIGVLVLLIATLLNLADNRKKLLSVGLIYITTVFLVYFAAGLGLLYFIQQFSIADTLSLIVGIVIIILGLIDVKDFFWYGKGISLSIPKSKAKKIKKYVKNVSIPGAIVLGAFVAAVELPCTGGPYLAIMTVLSKAGMTPSVLGLLALYNFIFVLPLIIILLLVYFGLKTDKVKEWKNEKRRWMRLSMGVVMIILGVLLIIWSQGAIAITLG